MRRIKLAVGCGLLGALAVGAEAVAQTSMGEYGGYPTPPMSTQWRGAAPVAAAMPGGGGNYGYVQQNVGRRLGMSPNAYYSANYFTSNPMSATVPGTGNANMGRVASPAPAVVNPGPMTYAPSQGATYNAPALTTDPPRVTTGPAVTYPSYASANATYYQTRRGGPFRRLFGGRR